jgi:hypothetical protein
MPKANLSIYQLKITLKDTRPPIWRRIQVKSDVKLDKLHRIFQIVMGWYDEHLHQFIIDGTSYGVPSTDFDFEIEDEHKVKLDAVVTKTNQVFIYEYDFGDGWHHQVKLEKILPYESGIQLPVCLAGKLACPPEDCGGVWGYSELQAALKDPQNPEREDLMEWIGDDFDPDLFSLDAINVALKNVK